jgi:integrase
MARAINKLTTKAVNAMSKSGYYSDGVGLYLQISVFGTKNWVFRFTLNGKSREMGLGPIHTISLAEARQAALECRKKLREGIDPIETRKALKQAVNLEAAKAITFDECAKKFIEAKQNEWKSAKHGDQWRNTLETYASPVIGKLSVAAVDTGLVMRVLEPIWTTKTETATRLRGRIESVLDWATVRGYRYGENPARWKGHLASLLAVPGKIAKVEHHAALPYSEIGDFIGELRKQEGNASLALEYCILTATRTSETLDATWGEIDFLTNTWTIPGDRMKAKREHRVPLADRAIQILQEMQTRQLGDYIFPGQRERRPLSNMSMLMALRRMGRVDLTTHGFRSTFRDWAAETTGHPPEVVEMALAHAVGNKVEAAYRRGDLFEKRVRLMLDWAKQCTPIAHDNNLQIQQAERNSVSP